MKILKRILIGLGVLVLLVLIVAAFVGNDFSVQREVTINKPKAEVFNYVKMVGNQKNFSVWQKKDPNAKMETSGTDGTVGFVSKWDSEVREVGKGEQQITAVKDGERMEMALHFYKPMDSKANAFFSTEAVGDNQTKVKWGFSGRMSYPMNIMLLFMNMDNMLGKELQEGLDNLKTTLETK